jgi:RNA polymerase sigma factor (sigma-70 family)
MDVSQYAPVIANVMRKLHVSLDQKDDMAQECYIKLLERQEELEAAKDANSLAATICKNRIIDLWRSEGSKVPMEQLDDPKVHNRMLRTPAPKPANVTADMLSEAMGQLTDEEGEVVYLLHVEGYTIPQVSELMCMSSATVRRRVEAGLNKLRKYFEE